MTKPMRLVGRPSSKWIGPALLGLFVLPVPESRGADGPPPAPTDCRVPTGPTPVKIRRATTVGTLGYGPPGVHPGDPGFGLGYHLGYGYGGAGLGVGAGGGYPLYGGPGYPHPDPCLRRIGGITPFLHYAGPGHPGPGAPNFFGEAGPLAPNPAVITYDGGPPDLGYGHMTGALPYPVAAFAPFASRPMADDAHEGKGIPTGDRSLGIVTRSVADGQRPPGLKITRMEPGGAAQKAGLSVGDLIRSANGYLTEQPANLTWILVNNTPDGFVDLNVLGARDGKERTHTAELP